MGVKKRLEAVELLAESLLERVRRLEWEDVKDCEEGKSCPELEPPESSHWLVREWDDADDCPKPEPPALSERLVREKQRLERQLNDMTSDRDEHARHVQELMGQITLLQTRCDELRKKSARLDQVEQVVASQRKALSERDGEVQVLRGTRDALEASNRELLARVPAPSTSTIKLRSGEWTISVDENGALTVRDPERQVACMCRGLAKAGELLAMAISANREGSARKNGEPPVDEVLGF